MIADDAAATLDRAFTDGYARHPDSDADLRGATTLAIDSIEDEPWEKWW